MVTLLVSDRGGEVSRLPQPLAGDRIAQWIRGLHDGTSGNLAWRVILLLTGIFPALLGVTGLLMWLRRRRQSVPIRSQKVGVLQAAE
jgi:uncharacterized iron-regulated membrane protein